MFGGEFFFIIIVAFLLFGSKNLPDVVRGYAKILATLKNATNEIKTEIQNSVDVKELDSSIKQITTSLTQEVEKVKENKTAFKPIEIVLTIESKDELDCLGSLFNHTAIESAMFRFCGVDSETIYKLFESLGSDIHRGDELNLTSKN